MEHKQDHTHHYSVLKLKNQILPNSQQFSKIQEFLTAPHLQQHTLILNAQIK